MKNLILLIAEFTQSIKENIFELHPEWCYDKPKFILIKSKKL
jgi:hypothetical protein